MGQVRSSLFLGRILEGEIWVRWFKGGHWFVFWGKRRTPKPPSTKREAPSIGQRLLVRSMAMLSPWPVWKTSMPGPWLRGLALNSGCKSEVAQGSDQGFPFCDHWFPPFWLHPFGFPPFWGSPFWVPFGLVAPKGDRREHFMMSAPVG